VWQTGQLSQADKMNILCEKLQQIEQQMQELEQLKSYVQEKLEALRMER